MGFERMCKVLQQKDSVYDTDLFERALQTLEKHTGLAYAAAQRRFRIIVDHARTAFMLINDGLVPSNIAAGYVLRMIIRRMIYNAVLLQPDLLQEAPMEDLLADLLLSFQGLRTFHREEILRVLKEEHRLFGNTLQSGKKILEGIMEKQLKAGKKCIEGSQLFLLYDSFGFPLELTREITQEKGFQIDEEGFQTALAAAKEKSRQATKEMFKKGIDWSKYLEGIPQTEFVGYTDLSAENATLLKTIELDD
jgi:alanyl-tRNA synthetase